MNDLLGSSCAIGAALVWAFAMVLFKKSGEKVPPMALNLFKNVVGILLLAATLPLMGHGLASLQSVSTEDLWILALSGFLGVTVADTLFFYSLNILGVGLVAIAECLYSPFMIFFSMLILAEALSPLQFMGAALVVSAILIASRHEPPKGRTRLALTMGILLAALAMAFMTFGVVIAKRTLERVDLIPATTIRMVAATIFLTLFMLVLPKQNDYFSVFRPSRTWKITVPGSILGAYLALILWTAGFKYTDASIAGILNQTNTIFSIILATVILKEAFTRRKLAAMILAFGGVVLVTFGK